MVFLIWSVSILYCVAKLYKFYKNKEVDPIFAAPGLETIAILVMAPVLMAVDVILTWVRMYKEYKEEKRDKIY